MNSDPDEIVCSGCGGDGWAVDRDEFNPVEGAFACFCDNTANFDLRMVAAELEREPHRIPGFYKHKFPDDGSVLAITIPGPGEKPRIIRAFVHRNHGIRDTKADSAKRMRRVCERWARDGTAEPWDMPFVLQWDALGRPAGWPADGWP